MRASHGTGMLTESRITGVASVMNGGVCLSLFGFNSVGTERTSGEQESLFNAFYSRK